MCFGFMGIQFGFALQNANVSRIFQTLGASIDDIPILWVAAPLTGLLVQPIIGYMSDRTWNSMGRRRPYFLVGAFLSSIALFIMPNSPVLWIAAGMLWIMDASINIAMEPFRAFVGDMLPEKQRTTGFAMQSFFIGVGSVVASALPWMLANWFDVSNAAGEGVIPDSVKYSFYAGGAGLFLAVLWTIIKTKEYSPEELSAFASLAQSESDTAPASTPKNYLKGGALWVITGLLSTHLVISNALDKQLLILTLGIAGFGIIQIITSTLKTNNKVDNALVHIVDDLFQMPKSMKQLAVVQFFSWFALFSMWIYTTPAVTSFHFGSSDPTTAAYNTGADWVGLMFAMYNVFAAVAAFFIPKFVNKVGRRKTHLINMILGGLGLTSIMFIKDPDYLLISMAGVGFAWASILSIPYALLASSISFKKMGTYMGIFNFFIVIPQLLAASVLGLLVRVLFNGEAIYAMLLGGIFMLLGGLSTLFIKTDEVK